MRKLRLVFILNALLILNASFTSRAQAAAQCGEAEKQSKIYKALTACTQMKTERNADALVKELQTIRGSQFCMNGDLSKTPSQALAKFCADPFAQVCSPEHQNILTSNCKLTEEAPADVQKLPEVVDENCQFLSMQRKLLDSHHRECASTLQAKDCDAKLQIKYRKDIKKMEIDLAYSPERVAHFSHIYDLVKNEMIQKIKNTSMIPPARQAVLILMIQKTTLALPPTPPNVPACANTSAAGPEAGFYNDSAGKIVVCIGAMESMNYSDDASLALTLGHELSHSIDPCALETLKFGMAEPDPAIGLNTYPGLLQCIRGGTGKQGCTGSVLHCTSTTGIHEYCTATMPRAIAKCEREALAEPSCEQWSTPDPAVDDSNDVTLFRTKGTPVDQTQEAFADYFGAEVVSSLIESGQLGAQPSDEERLDVMTATFDDLAYLHGGCRSENTKDGHPASFLRINRVMMSSPALRHALGCNGGPPKTPGAGVSCPGL